MIAMIAVVALIAVTAFGQANNDMIASLHDFLDQVMADGGLN